MPMNDTPRSKKAAVQCGIGVLYFLFGIFIHHFFTSNNIVGVIWPGAGLSLAAILLGGRTYIAGVFFGSFLLNLISNQSLWAIAGITLANVLEALLGDWLIMGSKRSQFYLRTLSDYLRLITLGGGVACVLGSLIGALALLLAGVIPATDYFGNVLIWWIGDTLGVMLVTPLIVAWWQNRTERLTKQQWLETIILIGITFVFGQIVFLDWFDAHLLLKPKAFIFFLLITWIAIRLGIQATIFTLNVIAIQALTGAFLQVGFFADEIPASHFQNYWSYILILSTVGMALATYVNEIMQKELSLQKSETHLRLSQKNGEIGTWEADLANNKQMWSENCISLLGFPDLTEPAWQDFMNAIHPDDRQRVIDAIESHIKNGTKYDVEYRIVSAGNTRWMRSSGQVEQSSDGNLTLMRGIVQNITERRQAEELLRESEQHFRTLANSGTALIWTSGIDKGCNYFNEPWLRFTNRTIQQERGDGWTKGVHPEDLNHCLETYASAFDKREHFSMEYRLLHADGNYYWLQDNSNPRYDVNGNFIGYIGFCHDITERKLNEHRRRQSEEKLRAFLNNISDTIWLIDSDLNISYVSPNVSGLLGFSANELVGSSSVNIIHPDDMAIVAKAQQFVMRNPGQAHTIQYRVHHKAGRWIFVESNGVNLLNNSDINGVLVSMRDISERKQIETDLRIAAIVFESQEGMFVTNAQNEILRVNSAFTTITGYRAEDIVGQNPRILQSGHHTADFYQSMWAYINQTGAWEGEIWNRRKNGDIFPEHLTITAVKDSDGIVANYVATLTDITQSKAAALEIERLAFYDSLTGLPNRQLLRDRLIPALANSHRSGQKGALLFIDLDNFKTLNDTLGHDMGDILLKKVAQRLESCVREGDTVARLGGDEFVVMLEDLSEQALEAAAQTEVIGHKILATLNQPYWLDTHSYDSTCSIGATLFYSHEQSIDELLKQADIAMYQAKTSGRNALSFFDPQMQASINARVSLEADLRHALTASQFILYYQPQFFQNGQCIGAEVLIRWQHPQRGLISPLDFIPLAEETGLMLPIGQWILQTACAQLKYWAGNKQTQELQLAVNVSARQFRQGDFVEQVSEIIRNNAINPHKLKLELTESMVLDDIDDAINKMNALRDIGVRFSLDDFGTGYSSLAYLTKLPLDQLKIDRSFVRNIGVKTTDAVIVQTIIGMAKNLGMDVIAEGVETEAQRQFLALHDCHLCQGFLFSQPVTIEQFESLHKQR